MQLPVEALMKRFTARQHLKCRQLIMLHTIGMHDFNLKQYAVGLVVALEYIYCRSKCVWREPVIGIEKTHIFTLCFLQSLIAGVCLTVILMKFYYFYACIASCIMLQNLYGTIGRSIVDADNLNVVQRLCQQRVEATCQPCLGIIDSNEDGDLTHGARILTSVSRSMLTITKTFGVGYSLKSSG